MPEKMLILVDFQFFLFDLVHLIKRYLHIEIFRMRPNFSYHLHLLQKAEYLESSVGFRSSTWQVHFLFCYRRLKQKKAK